MKLISALLFGIFLLLNVMTITADYASSDVQTLRKKFLEDLPLFKNGFDTLLISSEILNKRFNNQMEIIKDLENKLINKDVGSGEDSGYCSQITGAFNATLSKQNLLESRLLGKLEEAQDEQLELLKEILITHKLNETCSSPAASSNTLSLLSNVLSDVSEKLDKFVGLDEKLNNQQTKFDKFVENQLKVLHEINAKLTTNQQHFDQIKQELTNIKNLRTEVREVVMKPQPKLPMEVILGLTSANVTSLK